MYKWFNDLSAHDIIEHSLNRPQLRFGVGSNTKYYLYECCGFDIETTQIITTDHAHAYMYVWSFTYNDLTILGSYWEEFIELLDMLQNIFNLDHKHRLLIFIANMGFEFQFMRKWLNVTDSFFVDERKPLYIIHNEGIEFRDALQISGGNLATLAKNYTKTQKMVGDLDYNVLRNHSDARKLTSKELQYVLNDTIILAEYMEYYFRTFAPMGFLPLTKTGILRKRVQKAGKEAFKQVGSRISNVISMLHPKEELYELMMKWLFRGGYVHGTNETAGVVLAGLGGVDVTSMYPDSMFTYDGFPMGKFFRDTDLSINHYEELNEEFCTMAVIDFYDLDVTGAHSLESLNKVIEKENAHIDNGRIIDAKRVRVFLTNLDFDLYKKFYKWSKMEIRHLWKAKRGRLPRYLLDILYEYYDKKATLKRQGLNNTTDYALSKEMVNSGYGLTVTRMRQNTIIYNNNTDEYELDNSFVFSKEVSKQALLPQWGIWITAKSRHNLLSMVYRLEKEAEKNGDGSICVYEDTDSIKIRLYYKYKHIIEDYNKKHDIIIRKLCSKNGYSYESMCGLGSYDLEYPYIKRFKHNGAKRYAMKYYDFKKKEYKTTSTISGLKKGALLKYCTRTHQSVWEVFEDGMNIPIEETGKLASVYNDEGHSDIVNGELMEEQSSICLTPIEFTMSIDANYKLYFDEIEKRLKQNIL